ncbi:MAG: DUF3048 domain-containing protein [Acidimicrobiales bacterium]|nr:DUF3048 domain-containing protein [Acidimicrobiales bacterium]
MSRRGPIAVLAGLALVGAAACSSGGDQPVAAGVTTTEAPTTSAGESTTTTAAPTPTWPLTGIETADPAAGRPAVAVKLDNHPDARPHTGINDADLVYELKVEGITRLAAIFHSTDANPVGPIRSARSSDINLLANLARPLLLWSGGNPGVTDMVTRAASVNGLVDVSHSVGNAHYFRGSDRAAPHNLYANMSDIRAEFTPGDATPPVALFTYRKAGEASSGDATPGVTIDFGNNVLVDYVWDPARSCFARYQVDYNHPRGSSAFVDSTGTQACPANVVVMNIEYGISSADANSPEAVTVGQGDGLVLSDGKAVPIRWKRDLPISVPTITDAAGNPVGLTPGKTWVALPEAADAPIHPMDAGTAQSLLAGG